MTIEKKNNKVLDKNFMSQVLTFKDSVRYQIMNLIKLHDSGEDFEMLAYTQTFKRSKLDLCPFDVQHRCRSYDLWSVLNDTVNYWIIPEPTKVGNIHYHGIILSVKKRKKREWYNKALPTLKGFGFLKLDKIDNLTEWISYCLKDTDDLAYLGDPDPNNYLMYNHTEIYKSNPIKKYSKMFGNTYYKVTKVTTKRIL